MLDVVQHQYFDNSVPFAILAAVIIVAALAIRLAGADGHRPAIPGQLLIVCAAWIVVPTAVSLIYSAISDPFYYPRYLFFTAPAMAVVLAVCIVAVARKPRWIAAVLVVLAVAAVPNYLLSQRQRYAKEGWDYSHVADVISAQAAPGDCLLVDNTVGWRPGRSARCSRPVRRPSGRWSTSAAARAAAERGTLWDGHVAVWLVSRPARQVHDGVDDLHPRHDTARSPNRPIAAARAGAGHAPAYLSPSELGFRIVERWQFHRAQVVKSVR